MAFVLAFLAFSTVFLTLSWKKILTFSKKISEKDPLQLKVQKTMKILPSPPALPLLGHLHYFLTPNLDPLQVAVNWVKKYGTIFKIYGFSHNVVFLNEPTMVQKLIGSSNPSYLNKYRVFYDVGLDGALKDGLISNDYPLWQPHRRVMARGFTFQNLQGHLEIITKHTKCLITDLLKMNSPSATDGIEDIDERIHNANLKALLDTVLDLDTFTEHDCRQFHEDLQEAKRIGMYRIVRPWWLINSLWKWHPLCQVRNKALEGLKEFVKRALEKYKAEEINKNKVPKDGKLMIELLTEAGLSDKQVLDEAVTVVAAGHDTTVGSLTFLLFNLALNRDIQEKCRQEVDNLFNSKISEEDLTMDDLTKLKYLERCILENLRLYPMIPAFARTLEAPLELNEELALPEGTNVAIVPWTMHRNPEIFPDPEKFNPDRFIAEGGSVRSGFIPFSAGPRNCLGWKTAIISLKVVTALILRNFEVETDDTWENHQILHEVVLTTKNKINLRLKRRLEN